MQAPTEKSCHETWASNESALRTTKAHVYADEDEREQDFQKKNCEISVVVHESISHACGQQIRQFQGTTESHAILMIMLSHHEDLPTGISAQIKSQSVSLSVSFQFLSRRTSRMVLRRHVRNLITPSRLDSSTGRDMARSNVAHKFQLLCILLGCFFVPIHSETMRDHETIIDGHLVER